LQLAIYADILQNGQIAKILVMEIILVLVFVIVNNRSLSNSFWSISEFRKYSILQAE